MTTPGWGPRIRPIVFWGYTVLLMTATHVPGSALPVIPVVWIDKVEHFAAYGLWTTLLLWSGLLRPGPFRGLAARAMLWSVLLAVADELTQTIPALRRSGDALDAAADAIGSACAVCAFWIVTRGPKSRPDGG
jgi:hypothetical protein